MKSLMTAAAALALCAAAPALAQAQSVLAPTSVYGTLGYAGTTDNGADLGAIQGRLGARYGKYFGVEGEVAGGVKDDHTFVGNTRTTVNEKSQVAGYAVGFAPVTSQIELIGRAGYGSTDEKDRTASLVTKSDRDSWNYGVGAQYMVDDKNGVRADYTKQDYLHGKGDADTWSLAYSRKF